MILSICLIVKNEASMLERTLPGLSRCADEIVLLDTGSTDGTVAVAEKYGAKVHHFTWINDFAAARNESLKYAAGDWIAWIDADENLSEDPRPLLAASRAAAHNVVIYESKLGQFEKNNGYKRVKVFRNGQGYRFTRPINEQLVDREGKVVCGEDLPLAIYHWGKYLEDERMKAKRERYVAQYSQALEKLPNDAYLHNLLANILNDLGRLDEALVHYDQAYTLAPDKEIGRQSLEKNADLLLRQRKLREAAETAQHLLVISPDNLAARNVFASIYLVTGQVDKSIALLKETLALKLAGQVENLYNSQAMPNFLLSKAYELKGDREAAAACLQEYRRIMGK